MFKEKKNSKLILGSGIFIVLMAVITLSSTKLIGDTYAVTVGYQCQLVVIYTLMVVQKYVP